MSIQIKNTDLSAQDIVDIYHRLNNDCPENLRGNLIKIGTERGLDIKASTEAADQIIAGVDRYETTREMLEENTEAALQPFFEKL